MIVKRQGKSLEGMNDGNKKVHFFKLFSFADRYDVMLMMIGTLGAIGFGMAQPLMTVIFGQLINSLATSDSSNVTDNISKVCIVYLYLAIGIGIASFFLFKDMFSCAEVSCWIISGERQSIRIRGLYLKALLGQDVEFFDTQTSTGEVIERMSSDPIIIREALGEKVGKFIQLVTTFVGGFLVSFIRGWRLALVVCFSAPVLVVAGGCMSFIISEMAVRAQASYAQAGNVVEQTVASFNGEKQAIKKYDDKLEIAYSATAHQGLASGLGTAVSLLVSSCSHGLAIWYGSKLVLEKGYNGGETSPCLSAFAQGRAAAYTMFETINRKPKIYAYDEDGIILEDIKGEIELKDVYFRYPARPHIQILSGFSLHIPSGMTAALVGQSGNGKSTVISLLERFYDPETGEVLIDGVNLKKMQLKWIRSKMALVSQEPVLFTTTIRENIMYGKENATDEEIEAAIHLAPIARAILKNPRILLLDEATSALDAESERLVQNALDTVMASRTTVVIAHRLSTIRNAELIAVVHAGKLLEKGNHEELIKVPAGAYAQLVQMQSGKNHQAEEEQQVVVDIELEDIEQSSCDGSSVKTSPANRTSFGDVICSINTQETGIIGERKEETTGPKRVKNIPIKRIAYLNKPELLVLFLGSIAAVAHGVLFPIHGLIMSSSIKIFYEPPNKLRKGSSFWALMFVGLGFCSLLFVPLQNCFFGVAGGKLIQRIRSFGAVGARLATDASTMRSILGDALALVVQNVAMIAAGLVIAFTANWILALVILVLLPLLSLQGYIQLKFYKSISAGAKAMYEDASQVASDAVGNIRTISSFGAEEKVINLYQKKCEQPIKQAVKSGIVNGAGFGLSSFVLYSSTSIFFYIGSILQQHGRITFNEIFRVFFSLSTLSSGLSQSATLFSDLNKAQESIISIFEILDSKPEIDSSIESGTTLDQVMGNVELQHVSFKYPTRPYIQVFKDLSLTIPSGKTVALVGESGSGKSTIIGLLERFYNPCSGHIYLDGMDIQKFKISWLRQQLGLVSQEPILFNETIRANIAYGKQGGEQMSGGQKQRIAIARAVLKDPKILLLDEATSALDAESEHIVQDALDTVMIGRTTIVVAHKLSTIKGADIIAVMKNGVIAEKGRHDELLNLSGGVYATLAALQTTSI
ncbi:AAA+ ATPase domain-containing protein [Cynara cardunculus var. scolymus]|uniref:AAA+ ATPase domain-containing protein n=1 Tax=Cynara cardunculus var. scolymus TaxID=59895 RepID=A0A103Y1K8_CYNCS|nr:AAA+ ATPase domain-containing protein [Cynara cardunculus var. scolymus]